MRLRYAHLVRTPPLEDVAFVFGQETLLYGPDAIAPEKRKGAINFIVGVNGSGKSTLLRALYQVFRALKNRDHPPVMIRLAWEIGEHSKGIQTALLDCGYEKQGEAIFALLPERLPDSLTERDWRDRFAALPHDPQVSARGSDVPGHGALQQALPRRLIAYTSGAEKLWDELEEAEFNDVETLSAHPPMLEQLRPKGWNLDREQVLGRKEFRQEVPVKPPSEEDFGFIRRISQTQLRLAALALGIFESGSEFNTMETWQEVEAYRKELLHGQPPLGLFDSARRVLNSIDWFRCTHLSLVYSLPDELPDDLPTRRRLAQLYCLLGLAEEQGVLAEAMDRRRIVIRLGSAGFGVFLSERLRGQLNEQTPSEIAHMVAHVDGAKNGAEAVLRVFSYAAAMSLGLAQMFDSLCDWQTSGWLHDITLTIERTHLLEDTTDDDPRFRASFVTFDQLSDGEQMLVGRVALMFLLRYQDQSLLLLDEPETHFNDVWKREIINWIDDALLKGTHMQVLVATHTSIALTDVFATEITRLVKQYDGRTVATGISMPTFGADPGRIMQNVFAAEDTIGKRAEELLDHWLKLPPQDQATLEHLVRELGGGYHRAKLRGLLEKGVEPQKIIPYNDLGP